MTQQADRPQPERQQPDRQAADRPQPDGTQPERPGLAVLAVDDERPALEELTSMIFAGRLNPVTGGSYGLDDAAAAHEALRSRQTVGKLVIEVGAGVVK